MAFSARALSLSRTISRTGTLTLLCLAPTSLNCVFYRENNLGVAVHGNRLPTRRATAKVERVVPWRAVALAEAAQRVDKVIAALLPDICASGEQYGIVFGEADPPDGRAVTISTLRSLLRMRS